MNEIPDEFREKAFKDYLRIATGNAIISAQYVERVYNAISLIVLGVDKLPFDFDDFNSGDSSRMRQTLGQMKNRIKNTDLFSDSFIEHLTGFVKRRNRLVHGLFCDTFHDEEEIHPVTQIALDYVAECEWVTKTAGDLVETSFGIYAEIAERVNVDCEPVKHVIKEFEQFRTLGSNALRSF